MGKHSNKQSRKNTGAFAKRVDFIKKAEIRHLLISRVDAIGDVILTLPLLGLLKKDHPQLKISFLGRTYTQAILAACEHVDAFVNWDDMANEVLTEQAALLSALGCDAVLHVFPQRQVVKACKAARLPWRLGTANRLYHWTGCNRLTMMGRVKSPWHEAQLNIQLAQRLGLLPSVTCMPALAALPALYGLGVDAQLPEGLLNGLQNRAPLNIKQRLQDDSVPKVILHPGSRGSARDWPLAHFARLASMLLESGANVIITGTEAEGVAIRPALESVFAQGAVDATGRLTLAELLSLIAASEALVAASTGPLHMAAALGKRAVGIYPPVRPMHAGRWGPVGERAAALWSGSAACLACQSGEACACVQAVSPVQVLETVLSHGPASCAVSVEPC